MALSVFCSIDVPDWVIKECGIERAAIIALGLIDPDEDPSGTNLQSVSYWTGRINASPQNFFLVQPTRGEYTGGAAVEGEGFGKEVTRVEGADHSAAVEVEGLYDNRDFWEGVNRKPWKVVLFTAGDLEYYIQQPVSVYATIMNPKSPKNGAFWKVALKWQDISNPIILNTPTGLLATIG